VRKVFIDRVEFISLKPLSNFIRIIWMKLVQSTYFFHYIWS